MKLFTEREIRAAAIFLPLALLVLVGTMLARPKRDPQPALEAERRAVAQQQRDTLRPRPFDPNTVSYEELRDMGLTAAEAAGLIGYRASGKIFAIPEDVATCYAIGDSLYRQLKPCIRIRRRYVRQARRYDNDRMVTHPIAPQPFRVDTVSARYLRATGLLTQRRAETFVKWRNTHPIKDMDEVRKCYAIDDSTARVLEPYLLFPEPAARPDPRIGINGADSATLCTIKGIGPKTAGRIVAYRERLGGFVRVEQLAEVAGMTEANYERILQQIYCDSCGIRKIHINFAAPEEFGEHPYMSSRILRKIMNRRQQKGGWITPEAFYEEDILSPEEAARVAPYLSFGLPDRTDDRHEQPAETGDDAKNEDSAAANEDNNHES